MPTAVSTLHPPRPLLIGTPPTSSRSPAQGKPRSSASKHSSQTAPTHAWTDQPHQSAPHAQLLEGQAVERRHISKRHSDKKGDRLRGSAWTQSGRLVSARDVLRPGGAHAASRNAAANPHATSSGGLSPVNVASGQGPPLPGVMAMHGCSEEDRSIGQAGLHAAAPPRGRPGKVDSRNYPD